MATHPSEKTIKRLFALSGNRCAFPECSLPIVEASGVVTGEIGHIRAVSAGGPRFDPNLSGRDLHNFTNLILLCRHHHKVVDDQTRPYTVEKMLHLKNDHEKRAGRQEREGDRTIARPLIRDLQRIRMPNNSGNVAIHSPGSIQGHIINLSATSKKVVIAPPLGTIGADARAGRYIRYLIERYNKLASADQSRKTAFSYGAISRNIVANFGSAWALLPTGKTSEVIVYLQERIGKTRIARINKSKGQESYSTYEGFLAKHGL